MSIITLRISGSPVDKIPSEVKDIPYRRQRISEIVSSYSRTENVVVRLNERMILPKEWKKVRVKPTDVVDIFPQVGFLSLLFSVVWADLAWYETITWIVLDMAATYGVSYLGGKLLAPSPPEAKGSASPNEGWTPRSTMQEGLPVAKQYGRTANVGNIVGVWTSVDNAGNSGLGTEILYMLLCFGEGPYNSRVSDESYANGQPFSVYDNMTAYERLGTLDQSAIFSVHKLEYRIDREVNYGTPYTFTTPNDYFDDIEVTLEFPRGISYYTSSGHHKGTNVYFHIEVSVKDADSWTTITYTYVHDYRHTQIYRRYKFSDYGFTVTRGTRYDVRITKSTADSRERLTTDMNVRSIREVVNVAFKRPGKVLLGFELKGSEQLSGSSPTFDIVWEGRIVNVYNGGSWNLEFSQNRAWIVFDVITQPVLSGDGSTADPYVIERYEGTNPSQLDTAFFYEWAVWCEEQVTDGNGGTEDRMPCDYVADKDSDVWSESTDLAVVGRCNLYWKGNSLTGWIDAPIDVSTGGDPACGLITGYDITDGSWRNSWQSNPSELAGRVTVMFKDSLHDYERTSLPVYSEDAGNHKRRIQIEGTGVTSSTLATRVGNHALARNEKIRNMNRFEMGPYGLRFDPGDVVRLQYKKPSWGKTYKVVKTVSNDTIQVDRVPECAAGDVLYIQVFNESTGDIETDSYLVDSITQDTIKITTTWDYIPKPGCVVATGNVVLRRVIKNEWLPDHNCRITVETYDSTLGDSDEIEPVLVWPGYVSAKQSLNTLNVPVTRQEVQNIVTQRLRDVPAVVMDIPMPSNITWNAGTTGSGEIECYATDSDEEMQISYKDDVYYINTPTGGVFSTSDQFVFFDPSDMDSSGFTDFITTDSSTTAYTYLESGYWLMCINDDGTPHPSVGMPLLHAGILMAGTVTASLISVNGLDASGDLVPSNIDNGALSLLQTALHTPSFLSDVVVHFRCEDNAASTTVLDSGPNGYNGSLNGGENTEDKSITGADGLGFDFNGTDDDITTARTYQSTFQASFTISIWVKPDDGIPTTHMCAVGTRSVTGSAAVEENVQVFLLDTGKVQFRYVANDNGGNAAVTNSPVFVDGEQSEWTHVCCVADSTVGGVGGKKIYINGVEATLDSTNNGSTSGVTFSQYASTYNLYVGSRNNSGVLDSFWDGGIDEFVMFDKALSAAEALELFYDGANEKTAQNWIHPATNTQIHGGNIITNTITARQIAVADLAAINANLGTVTAGNVSACTLDVETADIVDLNVTTGKIANLNVTTGKIADDAVRHFEYASTDAQVALSSSGDGTEIQSVDSWTRDGANTVEIRLRFNFVKTDTVGYSHQIKFFRDTTTIRTVLIWIPAGNGYVDMAFLYDPPTGTDDYSVKVLGYHSGDKAEYRQLSIEEFKDK